MTNTVAQSNFFANLHGGMTESEYRSNLISAIRHAPPPKPWPEPSQRQLVFGRCAEVLRSAIDTNQIELICSNMAANLPTIRKYQNQPTHDGPITITYVTNDVVISRLRNFSRQTMLSLDEFASLLNSPDLESYVGAGYCAKISTPANYLFWLFWPDGMVRSIEKRTADGQRVIIRASFFENGKLAGFYVISPPESIAFDLSGKLTSYAGRDNNMTLELRPDESGNVKVRGFILKNQQH